MLKYINNTGDKDESKIKENLILVSLISVALLGITGLTYSFFSNNVEGEGNEMIVHTSKLELRYTETNEVSMSDAYPGQSVTKTFSVENTGEDKAYYTIFFIDLVNEFLNDELVYKLYRNDELVIDTISVEGTVILEDIEINASDKHEYKLVITFIETGSDQNYNQGKSFSGTIHIEEPNRSLDLKTKILAQNRGKESIEAKETPEFSTITTAVTSGIYATQDEYGTSYYYRGERKSLANNVIFANHQWKIIRINGDGSIRMIYNGTCPNNSCTINSEGLIPL